MGHVALVRKPTILSLTYAPGKTDRYSWHYGSQDPDSQTIGALLYLAAPTIIFATGWFCWPIALALIAATAAALLSVLRASRKFPGHGFSVPALILIVSATLGWTAFGGGSHFVYANPDWFVRDVVLADLINRPWPVIYQVGETECLLRSAIGYFLPLALFGKMFGTTHLDWAIYAWTAAGVLISLLLLPLPRSAGWPLAMSLLIVILFSGMDFLGQVIATESMPLFPMRLEWWVPLSYPSLTNQLLWAPNHCLPIWISSLLLFRHWQSPKLPAVLVALLPLSLIWTPFAAIGVAPFALLGIALQLRKSGRISVSWYELAAGAVIALPVGLFLITDLGSVNAATVASETGDAVSYTLKNATFREYALFVVCEFLCLALVLAPHVKHERGAFWLAVALLLALPLFRLGPSNDLLLRLCAPSLLVLLIASLEIMVWRTPYIALSSRIVPCLILAIGAHTAVNEFWRALSYHRWLPNYTMTLADTQEGHILPHHYVARKTSFILERGLRESR